MHVTVAVAVAVSVSDSVSVSARGPGREKLGSANPAGEFGWDLTLDGPCRTLFVWCQARIPPRYHVSVGVDVVVSIGMAVGTIVARVSALTWAWA